MPKTVVSAANLVNERLLRNGNITVTKKSRPKIKMVSARPRRDNTLFWQRSRKRAPPNLWRPLIFVLCNQLNVAALAGLGYPIRETAVAKSRTRREEQISL
jgi:hypothetical protein